MEMINSVGESNYDYYLGIKEREIGFLRERNWFFERENFKFYNVCVFFFGDTLIFKFIMHIKKITIVKVPKIQSSHFLQSVGEPIGRHPNYF